MDYSIRRVSAAAAACVLLAALGACTGRADSPQPALAAQLGLPTATPESQGFSSAGLAALTTQMHALVDEQELAGVTTLIARHGKVVHYDTYGKANVATGEALRADSIFRIASMTKPITGVAMMQLYEQGKWQLDDPVARYIPEFANLQVKTASGATEPQKSPMTMAQLMSHSAGFGVSATYRDAGLSDADLQGMIDKLKNLPLETQPGTAWDYGPGVNIQGYIVEKLSGQSLDAYFAEHIFQPLGMVDTGFWAPHEKAGRVVAIHTYDDAGRITAQAANNVRTARPRFLSGSGGLMSTAADYWRFCQALVNGGALDGKRILEEQTVKLMRTNVLPPGVKLDLYGPNQEGIGFGLDFAVVTDPKAANTPQGLNSFYWGGAFGTWFWIDPVNDLLFVGMIQNLNGSRPNGGTPHMRDISYTATYAALAEPSSQTTAHKQTQQVKRTILHKADVPDSNYEVVLARVDVPAGTSAGRHTHPGTVVGYVLEGEYTMLIDGSSPRVLRPGESLEVPSGAVHDERTGDQPATLLAVFTVEKGKPLATPAQ